MAMPTLISRDINVPRPRFTNTRGFTVFEKPQVVAGANNGRMGLILQNQSAANTVFVNFADSSNTTDAFIVPPLGQLSLDFAVGEPIYCFTSVGVTAKCVLLEASGFDAFQLHSLTLLTQIAEYLAQNQGRGR